MKKIYCLLVLLLAVSPCFGEFYPDKLPPRKIVLDSADKLVIAEKAKGLEIVVAADALPITVFAAQELQQFMQKVLSTEIPIVNKVTPEKISWIIGINEWSRKAGISEKGMVRDSFRILRDGKKIYIAGLDGELVAMNNGPKQRPVSVKKTLEGGIWRQFHAHATLFGVYDFLERFAGVRFYFTGEYGTVVPRAKALELPGIDIFDRPDYQVRYTDIYYGHGEDSKHLKSKRNAKTPLFVTPERNLAGWRNRMGTDTFSAMHGENKLWLSERFGKSHPEYFSLREDKDRMIDSKKYGVFAPQVCTESKVIDEIYLDAKAALTGKKPSDRGINAASWHPATLQKNIVNLSYNDGMYFCRCEKCRPVYQTRDRKKISNHLWKFQGGIAQRLKQENVPGFVCTLAYTTTLEVPDMPLPDNMVIDLAVNRGAYSFSRSERYRKYQLRLMEQWNEKIGGERLFLTCYLGKLGAQLIPTLPDFCHRTIGQYYSYVSKYTKLGFGMYGGSENYLFGYLNRYIFYKLMWDNSCDWEKVLSEHYQKMFGKAAPVLENIYNELEELWTGEIAGKFTESNLGDIPVVPSDRKVWTEIYSPAFLKKLAAQFDKAEKIAADDPESLARVKFIRKQILQPMQEYSAKFLMRSNDTLGLRVDLPKINEQIKLDGKLNEKAWKKASLVTLRPFKQKKGLPYPSTAALIMEDEQNLYMGLKLAEPDSAKLESAISRPHDHGELWRDDLVEIFLKTDKTSNIFYQFMVNYKGSTADLEVKSFGRTFKPSYDWQSNIAAAAHNVPGGVELELRIPKKNIPDIGRNDISFNIVRTRRHPGNAYTMMSWTPFLKARYHEPDAFGSLERKSQLVNVVKDHSFSMPLGYRGKKKGVWNCAPKFLNNSCIALDSEQSMLGSRSLKLTQTENAGKYFGVQQDLPALKPNTRYRISYYLKTKDIQVKEKTGGTGIGIRDKGNNWLPGNRIRGTNDWHYLSFDYTTSDSANVGKNYAVIQCIMSGVKTGGSAWFDGVRVEELGSAWSTH